MSPPPPWERPRRRRTVPTRPTKKRRRPASNSRLSGSAASTSWSTTRVRTPRSGRSWVRTMRGSQRRWMSTCGHRSCGPSSRGGRGWPATAKRHQHSVGRRHRGSPDLGIYQHLEGGAHRPPAPSSSRVELLRRSCSNAIAPACPHAHGRGIVERGRGTSRRVTPPRGSASSPHLLGAPSPFSASDRASWITGTILVIDGGQLLAAGVADREAERLA